MSRFGLAARYLAGKRKDLGSIPPRLSFFFMKKKERKEKRKKKEKEKKKDVVCGHCLVTLSITSN